MMRQMEIKAGKSCLYSCLTNLLRYYGFHLRESDVFFICGGLHYKYLKSGTAECKRPGDRFIYRNIRTIAKALQQIMGCTLCYGDSLQPVHLRRQVYEGINNHNPVMLLLNPSVLQYTPRDFDPEGQFELHCILLNDIRQKQNLAHIIDSYVVDNSGRVSVYNGTVSTELLLKEVKGFLFFDEVAAKTLTTAQIRQKVCDTLQQFLAAAEDDYECTGWAALHKCIENMAIVRGKEETFINSYYLELSYLIRAHFLIMFDYLSEALTTHARMEAGDITGELEGLRSEWSVFCMKLWKASFHGRLFDVSKGITEGKSLIREIRELLEDIVVRIQK